MAKRVYLAESDGTTFHSKSEAEAHDEKVFAEKKNETFQEKFAVFISETDLTLEYGESEAAAISDLLGAIRDYPIAFMEVMEVVLPKQWQRKMKSRRGGAEPPKKAPTKKAPSKKEPSEKAPTMKAPKKKPKPGKSTPSPDEVNKDLIEKISGAPEETIKEAASASPLASSSGQKETPRYMAEERENGAWAILDNGKEIYDEFHGFDDKAALQAAGILNAGLGRDGWDKGSEGADLLRDRMLAEGWVDPASTPPPPPPEEESSAPPPPPPEESGDVLTPLPPMSEESWRDEDESPIPPVD